MFDEHASLEDLLAYFGQDTFASNAGCIIVEARPYHAVCEMAVEPHILNARGTVMGGALFTLADFTMAVAANLDNRPTVSVDCAIRFLSSSKGTKLIATCDLDKDGKSLAFYTVTIVDDLGKKIASFTATASHI